MDLEGFIKYLGLKIAEGHMCIYCNNKGRNFHSCNAVQRHMIEKVCGCGLGYALVKSIVRRESEGLLLRVWCGQCYAGCNLVSMAVVIWKRGGGRVVLHVRELEGC